MIPSHQLSLKLIQRCPACEMPFQQAQVTILSETNLTVLAHLHCTNCRVNLLANVVNMPQGLVGNAMLTDLTVAEALRLLELKQLTEDDFLSLYKSIKNTGMISTLTNGQESAGT